MKAGAPSTGLLDKALADVDASPVTTCALHRGITGSAGGKDGSGWGWRTILGGRVMASPWAVGLVFWRTGRKDSSWGDLAQFPWVGGTPIHHAGLLAPFAVRPLLVPMVQLPLGASLVTRSRPLLHLKPARPLAGRATGAVPPVARPAQVEQPAAPQTPDLMEAILCIGPTAAGPTPPARP